MITVTKQKPIEEITRSLEKCPSVFIIGCGTCATQLHTGGKTEVLDMKTKMEAAGKKVTGWMVIPTACDELTKDALSAYQKAVDAADCLLVMSCAFGVQTVRRHAKKHVAAALNTLFLGKEEKPGEILEICTQCGNCVLDKTGGICPVIRCAKGLLNGPCGGSVRGKCEVSPETACAWQLIIDRLTEEGRLDELEEIMPLRDWSTSPSGGPRKITIK
ncbi:MAG: methylenetetrahydrofolate reductase C-terminal domain-containing protein [Dehalococcoidia bacterium]|nr:methylenetetrahydrofolate reductase C-terminal domain-containing protein [Dehalococcoidia bacterium]